MTAQARAQDVLKRHRKMFTRLSSEERERQLRVSAELIEILASAFVRTGIAEFVAGVVRDKSEELPTRIISSLIIEGLSAAIDDQEDILNVMNSEPKGFA